jgi:hypothetical protein
MTIVRSHIFAVAALFALLSDRKVVFFTRNITRMCFIRWRDARDYSRDKLSHLASKQISSGLALH